MRETFRIILWIFLITTAPLYLTSCWNYREIDKIAVVAGMAVDKNPKNNNFICTVEILDPTLKAGEGATQSVIISEEGTTIFDTVRNLIMKLGKKAYWAHAKIVILSEAVSKEGVLQVLDWIDRDAEVRSDMLLAVSREKTAAEVLKTEGLLIPMTSLQINEILKTQRAVAKTPSIELYKFIDILSTDKTENILPTITLQREGNKKIPKAQGAAIFKKDKLIGFLDGSDTMKLLWILDEVDGGIVDLPTLEGAPIQISLEIYRSRTKVIPVQKGEELQMLVTITPTLEIGEVGSHFDFTNQVKEEQFKHAVERYMEKHLEDFIRKIQREYNADIFQFGSVVKRKNPRLWREIEPQWDKIFSDLKVNVEVKIKIRGSATTSEPISIGE